QLHGARCQRRRRGARSRGLHRRLRQERKDRRRVCQPGPGAGQGLRALPGGLTASRRKHAAEELDEGVRLSRVAPRAQNQAELMRLSSTLLAPVLLLLAQAASPEALAQPPSYTSAPPNCRNTGSFEGWLDGFRKEAIAGGVSRATVAAA